MLIQFVVVAHARAGLVTFTSDFCLLHNSAPGGQGDSSSRVLVDVVNRGRKIAVKDFNVGADATVQRDSPPGDGFLFAHGFSVLSIGWQWDVYSSESLLGLRAPELTANGAALPGQVVVEIWPNALAHTWALASREHKPYPAIVDGAAGKAAVLLVSDWHGGPERVVPRHSWRFARQEDQSGRAGSIIFSGQVVPSKEHIYLESGFIPGKFYQLIYTARAANLAGAGVLAVREAANWLRQPSSDLNPLCTPAVHVYAYGNSQTGRLLRHFLHLGLNVAEDGTQAYDGLLPHVSFQIQRPVLHLSPSWLNCRATGRWSTIRRVQPSVRPAIARSLANGKLRSSAAVPDRRYLSEL